MCKSNPFGPKHLSARMFAYVKYTDGFKAIVATQNFNLKTYQADILYPILWEENIFQRPGSACERYE